MKGAAHTSILIRIASFENLVLLLFLAGIFGVAVSQLWMPLPPSDPLEYVGPAIKGSTIGFWPWFDRITLGSTLRAVWILFPGSDILFGPSYAISITLLTVLLGTLFLRRNISFVASLCFLVLCFSSYFIFFFSVQVFPEPTLVLYALIGTILFTKYESSFSKKYLFASGLFAALTCTTKVTGIALPIALVAYHFASYRNSPRARDLFILILGIGAGFFVAVLSFAALFGWSSLTDSFAGFVGSGVKQNIVGRVGYNNAVTYWDVFFDRTHFPVFISALVFSGTMFSQKRSRLLAIIGWSFFLTIYGIYWISGRGFVPIANYAYPAYFFFLVALSTVAHEFIEQTRPLRHIILISLIFGVWLFGYQATSGFDPALIFEPKFLPGLQTSTKLLASFGVLAIIALLIIVRLRPTRKMWSIFFIAISFWGGFYSVRKVQQLVHGILIPETEIYYRAAAVMGEVHATPEFDILVPAWQGKMDVWRLRWIYRIFYASHRTDVPQGPRSYAEFEQQINSSIDIISTDQLKNSTRPVLTSKPDLVKSEWQDAKLLEQFVYDNVTYSVLQRSTSTMR